MPENPIFVVNDRRKFNADGELRHEPSSEPSKPEAVPEPSATSSVPSVSTEPEASLADALAERTDDGGAPAGDSTGTHDLSGFSEDDLPPGPSEEQSAEATRAYDATVDRLDTALRAADPGAEHMPPMNFERLIQSLYTQALLLLGGATQPGETPRVDILGARQTIDMLAVVAERTQGNLSPNEDKLLQSALFDLRMGFLEITQALARQARQGAPGGPGGPIPSPGPRIVR